MFQDCKEVCDHLIVGLHIDPSIERPEKMPPILSVEERTSILLELRSVDEVVTYNTEAELVQLLEELKPDVRVLGTDYKDRSFTGDHLNIPIHYHERNHEWSTTRFKKEIAKSISDLL